MSHRPGPTRYRIMLDGISKRTMPSESICCPTLNWFWVIPRSLKKPSVSALEMLPRSGVRGVQLLPKIMPTQL